MELSTLLVPLNVLKKISFIIIIIIIASKVNIFPFFPLKFILVISILFYCDATFSLTLFMLVVGPASLLLNRKWHAHNLSSPWNLWVAYHGDIIIYKVINYLSTTRANLIWCQCINSSMTSNELPRKLLHRSVQCSEVHIQVPLLPYIIYCSCNVWWHIYFWEVLFPTIPIHIHRCFLGPCFLSWDLTN